MSGSSSTTKMLGFMGSIVAGVWVEHLVWRDWLPITRQRKKKNQKGHGFQPCRQSTQNRVGFSRWGFALGSSLQAAAPVCYQEVARRRIAPKGVPQRLKPPNPALCAARLEAVPFSRSISAVKVCDQVGRPDLNAARLAFDQQVLPLIQPEAPAPRHNCCSAVFSDDGWAGVFPADFHGVTGVDCRS